MDDKEEQTEESRAVSVGQKKTVTPTLAEREEHERAHIPYRSWCRQYVAARASNPSHRGRKFAKAVEDDKDMKQVSYDYCFMRDQSRMESATILVSKEKSYPNGSCVEKSSSLGRVGNLKPSQFERTGLEAEVLRTPFAVFFRGRNRETTSSTTINTRAHTLFFFNSIFRTDKERVEVQVRRLNGGVRPFGVQGLGFFFF